MRVSSSSETWTPEQARRREWYQLALVFGVSLGASAVYAVVALVRRLASTEALKDQTATINKPLATDEIFDLIYQLLGVGFALFPVALALYFLWQPGRNPFRDIGLDFRKPWANLGGGVALAALIGIPGIGLYLVGNALGFTVTIVPTALNTYWWTTPVLVLAALKAALQEEIIVVAFLFAKLRNIGVRPWVIVTVSALVRGSYHLYQGFGPFVGNAIMGAVFGWAYLRWGRIMPLVIAHWILDIVSFTGYALVAAIAPGFLPGT